MPELQIHIEIIYLYSNSNNLVTYFHWKILALAGILAWDLPGTKPICYQLNYPGLDTFLFFFKSFKLYFYFKCDQWSYCTRPRNCQQIQNSKLIQSRRRRRDKNRKRKKWRHHLKHQSYVVEPSDSICCNINKLLLRNIDHRWWKKKETSHKRGSKLKKNKNKVWRRCQLGSTFQWIQVRQVPWVGCSYEYGAFLTFYVIFAPLEYIPTIPPLSSYVINIYFKRERKP